MLWGLLEGIHPSRKADDIVVSAPAGAPAHERSLQAYAEVLYLCNSAIPEWPTLDIYIKGMKVTYRDWAEGEYLIECTAKYSAPKPQPHTVTAQFPQPNSTAAKETACDASAKLWLGYPITMLELDRVLKTNKGKGHQHDELLEMKNEVKAHTGIFYYHRGRLTRALVPTKCQGVAVHAATAGGGAQLTSRDRIRKFGLGLTGYILENYRVQQYNKAGYKDENLFARLLENANSLVRQHLKAIVVPAHTMIRGDLPPGWQPTMGAGQQRHLQKHQTPG